MGRKREIGLYVRRVLAAAGGELGEETTIVHLILGKEGGRG